MSEHDSLCIGMKPTPRVCFAEAMIADMRQRYYDAEDDDILKMREPLFALREYAEDVSYAASQRRLIRGVHKMGVEAQHGST